MAEQGRLVDPEEALDRLLRDLRSRPEGLTDREAARRLEVSGRNELVRRGGRTWPGQLGRQLVHPLALLLWAAAVLAWIGGTPALAVGIVGVVLLNALFAFVQERHAERAVEALTEYLPPHATVRRDGEVRTVDARGLFTNPLLLWGIAFEVVFAACVVLVPWLQPVFGTTAPQWWQVALLVPMPFLVWGLDELWRWTGRRRTTPSAALGSSA